MANLEEKGNWKERFACTTVLLRSYCGLLAASCVALTPRSSVRRDVSASFGYANRGLGAAVALLSQVGGGCWLSFVCVCFLNLTRHHLLAAPLRIWCSAAAMSVSSEVRLFARHERYSNTAISRLLLDSTSYRTVRVVWAGIRPVFLWGNGKRPWRCMVHACGM